uniref:C2 domain-containing protein n=1 Tax=Hemiselmis andersenii TaxID=464988 RepID=A0A7S0TLK2_HEMAN|mmetsp:Transcript_18532/g.42817  ORF Transcript_18532/g.42817 Transcript_18532/m.42817 type:complete len:482 (+) Transcript_18532:174-1619(+)
MGDSNVVYSGKVHIKVVRADDLRQHLNRKPAPMAMLRVSVAGVAQQELMKTNPMPNSTSPEWNQEFVLPVPDASQSQLECTIWDTSDPNPTEFSNFLGEVLLNLAKLIPYKGHYIEQVFFVKQGKTIKTEQQATGNLKLGLRLDISEQPRSPGAEQPRSPVAEVRQEAAAAAVEDAAAKAARETKEAAERERAVKEEQERRAREAEQAAERAAQQAAEARRAAEAQRAQAERARSPSPERRSPERPASPERSVNKSSALDVTTGGGTRTRIVIAVIEASNLPHGVDGESNPMAVVRVQGPAGAPSQQTKASAKTREPFWNEKFVFGVEEAHVPSSSIVAEVVSGQEVVGTVAPVPIRSLLNGQKMSLPTINNGADIYCVDGWFDVHPGRGAPSGGVSSYSSPTKIAGKAQLHLRMTFIPAAGVPTDAVGQRSPSPARADHSVNTSAAGPRVLHHQLQRLPGGAADIGVLLRSEPVAAGGEE